MPDPDGIPTEGEWLEGHTDEYVYTGVPEDLDDEMVDLGGGMIVPLREMFELDEDDPS